jgi:hypothetical protein
VVLSDAHAVRAHGPALMVSFSDFAPAGPRSMALYAPTEGEARAAIAGRLAQGGVRTRAVGHDLEFRRADGALLAIAWDFLTRAWPDPSRRSAARSAGG